MKRLFLMGVLCLSLTGLGFSMGFSVKATGGLSLLFGGDRWAVAISIKVCCGMRHGLLQSAAFCGNTVQATLNAFSQVIA